ncbi:TPA: cation diffusion facilitator family transporter [Stenotrophomonas maltophilia]|uniref:Cation diffusion facilitator family transporter n=1 Tax=Marilutibacter maris TaxID=1605891 RepID=A0A508B1C9_9GAMM|nr:MULTISPECIES: cation diffusion facilitator family transporter [Xanthomonadaceae]KAB8188916.1 cation diffusion facilitator family transporter [Lysobacter maris]KYK39432.1 cation transporter [Stenotrophomonas maltophilia]MBN5004127.1 cation diffusion facilitator family transporter [Stenotrophomonas maltophilia]MCF3494286.1 cation diffusion facilitator family transporter [Stenotrophomonas maltophilia]MCF3514594.1 cation diffusion facilitator family transporter [Stenotrophomonas maltophilia]
MTSTRQEQRVLQLSIAGTVLVAAIGFFGGMLARSQAILFDGIYSLVDVALTLVALAVLRLMNNEQSPRFQYGFWHLEPMVEALGGAILSLACIYAMANAVIGFSGGGHETRVGPGLAWAALLAVVDLVMAVWIGRHARRLESGLLALDARAWLLTGLMSLAVVLSFVIALALRGGSHAHWIPYLDPLVLAVISLAALPVPLRAAWKAAREVLQVAPSELDAQVQTVMEQFVAEHRFEGFTSHVAKMGRMQFIEIHILTRPDTQLGSIGDVDRLRDEIATRLDARSGRFWLTIDFTSDPAWT